MAFDSRGGWRRQPGLARMGGIFPPRQQRQGDGTNAAIQPEPVAAMAVAQTGLSAQPVAALHPGADAPKLWTPQTANHGEVESCPMNELGEPNMGKPSVRFDEGRERVGHWPRASQPILSCLLYFPRRANDLFQNEPIFQSLNPESVFLTTQQWTAQIHHFPLAPGTKTGHHHPVFLKTALLIDEDHVVRLSLAQWLRQAGWAILEAEDGETGLALALDKKPDLV